MLYAQVIAMTVIGGLFTLNLIPGGPADTPEWVSLLIGSVWLASASVVAALLHAKSH